MWADLVQWLLFQFRHPLQSPSWGNGFEVLFGMNIVGLDWDALEIAGMLTNQTNWNCGTKCSVSIKIFGSLALLVSFSLNCLTRCHWWLAGKILPQSVSWVLEFQSPLEFVTMRRLVVECCSCHNLHTCCSKWQNLCMHMEEEWSKFWEAQTWLTRFSKLSQQQHWGRIVLNCASFSFNQQTQFVFSRQAANVFCLISVWDCLMRHKLCNAAHCWPCKCICHCMTPPKPAMRSTCVNLRELGKIPHATQLGQKWAKRHIFLKSLRKPIFWRISKQHQNMSCFFRVLTISVHPALQTMSWKTITTKKMNVGCCSQMTSLIPRFQSELSHSCHDKATVGVNSSNEVTLSSSLWFVGEWCLQHACENDCMACHGSAPTWAARPKQNTPAMSSFPPLFWKRGHASALSHCLHIHCDRTTSVHADTTSF